MIKNYRYRIILNQFLFFFIFALGLFILLSPITLLPTNILLPETTLLITLILIIRSPDYVPFWLIFLTFILSDFLLTKPLGLNTFIVLIITEFVRRNRPAFVEMLFLSEWLVISIILFFASLLKEILLILSLSERNGWIETLQQIGVDIFMYPIVVILVRVVFQVKKTEKSKKNKFLTSLACLYATLGIKSKLQ